MRSIVIYGPPRSGKTFNAEKLAGYFGLKKILDGFDGLMPIPKSGTLILCQGEPEILEKARGEGLLVMSIQKVLRQIRLGERKK